MLLTLSLPLSTMVATAQQVQVGKTIDPKLSDILVRGGKALKAENFNGARALYAEALAIDSTNLEALRNYALSLSRLGKKADAIEVLNRAIKQSPNDPELYNNLGVTFSDIQNTEQAIAAFRNAIARDSMQSLYHTNLGGELAKSKKPELALESLRTAAKMDSVNTSIPFWMGNAFASQRKFDSAAYYYQRCLDRGQQSCEVYHFLAVAQRNLGKQAESEQTMLKGIQADTTCAVCFSDLGMIYAQQGKYIAAQVNLEKAVRFDSTNYNAWIALGTSYYMSEMFAKSDSVVWRLKHVDSNLVNRMLNLIKSEVDRKNKPKLESK